MDNAVHKIFKLTHNRTVGRLPRVYLDQLEQSRRPRERVHDTPVETKYLDYNQDHETGYVYREPDYPIPVIFPPRSEKGLWGGLGCVEGFTKPKKFKPRHTRLWDPDLEKHTFYSEILDVHINIEVTHRTLLLIDEHKGFDWYILETPVQDLQSELGRRLKHKMLIALAIDKRDVIIEKYKKHVKPIEEVQWAGLKIHEAISKARSMRVEETIEPPLKLTYARELLAQLKSEKQTQIKSS